jgi:hypothetical protein
MEHEEKEPDYVAFDEVFVISRINCFAVAWISTIFDAAIEAFSCYATLTCFRAFHSAFQSQHNSMILLFLRSLFCNVGLLVCAFLPSKKACKILLTRIEAKTFHTSLHDVCLNIYGIIQLDASDAKKSSKREMCT